MRLVQHFSKALIPL